MPPEFESIFNTGSLYIQNEDGTKSKLGKIQDMNITVDVANGKDFTSYNIGRQSYEGSFEFNPINKNIFRELTDKSYRKYLKRVRNRNKLHEKLKKLGR
jgi:hypothetical protein